MVKGFKFWIISEINIIRVDSALYASFFTLHITIQDFNKPEERWLWKHLGKGQNDN